MSNPAVRPGVGAQKPDGAEFKDMAASSEQGPRSRSPDMCCEVCVTNGGKGHGFGTTKEYLLVEEKVFQEMLGSARRQVRETDEARRARGRRAKAMARAVVAEAPRVRPSPMRTSLKSFAGRSERTSA